MVSKHSLLSASGLQNNPYGLHIICFVGKFLSMVESSKAIVKDYTKLLVTDEMIEYGKGKLEEAKEAEEAEFKVNKEVVQLSSDEDDSSDEGCFGDEDVVLFNNVKYPLTDAEIRMFKERPTTSRAPTRQVASNSTRSRAPSTGSRAPTSTRSRAPTASTSTFKASTRSRAPTTCTSNAKYTSTSALRGYKKIAMTRCVLGLRALNNLNAPPPLATRKRKSKK
ncbi:hypothetical protein Tco_1063696 [Tanacetum coccineum]